MVNLSIVLKTETVQTPDVEFRIKSAWRLLAEMVLKMEGAERDSEQIPAGNPQELERLPSQTQDTPIFKI